MRIVFVAACVAIAASAVVVEQSPMQFPEVQSGGHFVNRNVPIGDLSLDAIRNKLEAD